MIFFNENRRGLEKDMVEKLKGQYKPTNPFICLLETNHPEQIGSGIEALKHQKYRFLGLAVIDNMLKTGDINHDEIFDTDLFEAIYSIIDEFPSHYEYKMVNSILQAIFAKILDINTYTEFLDELQYILI